MLSTRTRMTRSDGLPRWRSGYYGLPHLQGSLLNPRRLLAGSGSAPGRLQSGHKWNRTCSRNAAVPGSASSSMAIFENVSHSSSGERNPSGDVQNMHFQNRAIRITASRIYGTRSSILRKLPNQKCGESLTARFTV